MVIQYDPTLENDTQTALSVDITATAIEDEVHQRLGLKDNKVTLGRIINAIVYLSAVIPHDGGLIIKLIKDKITTDNLPIDFITAQEQAKLRAFEINNLPAGTPPIPLDKIVQMSQGFLELVSKLNGPNGNDGLLADFVKMNGTIGVMQTNAITTPERSKISAIDFLDKDPQTGDLIHMDHQDFERRVKLAAGTTTAGITPSALKNSYESNPNTNPFQDADLRTVRLITVSSNIDLDAVVASQTKIDFITATKDINLDFITTTKDINLDHIAVTTDIDLDAITLDLGEIPLIKDKTDNLSITPATPMLPDTTTSLENIETTKDIQLNQPQVLPTDELEIIADNRLITVANALGAVTELGAGIDDAFEQIEESLAFAFPSGDTASRPTDDVTQGPVALGQQYYDTTISKPVWFNGTDWLDAMGNKV